MRISRPVVFLILSILMIPASIQARLIRVPRQGIETIQAGIDTAFNGDTVLVDEGIYYENIYFDGKTIVVGSLILIDGDEDHIESTVIDGDSVDVCVAFNDEEGEGAVLRGFTLQNGVQMFGGGIDVQGNASPLLVDLIVKENRAEFIGGGIYCTWESTPTIMRTIITRNVASDGAGLGVAHGAHPLLIDCEITENFSTGLGGGVYVGHTTAECTLIRVLIAGNEADLGGGIYIENSIDCYFINCTISNNIAAAGGGGYVFSSFAFVEASFTNTIIFGNNSYPVGLISEGGGDGGRLDFSYSLVDGGLDRIYTVGDSTYIDWDGSNLSEDPLMVDFEEGEYHLTVQSPCIDAGDPDQPVDQDSTHSDMGAYAFAHLGEMRGYVYDDATGDPIEGTLVSSTNNQETITDIEGYWLISPVRGVDFDLTVTAEGYNPITIDTLEFDPEDTLEVDFRLKSGVFVVSIDSVYALDVIGSSSRANFTISNQGEGSFDWKVESRLNPEYEIESWTLLETTDIAEVVEDSALTSLQLSKGYFLFLAGEGKWRGEDEDDKIYFLRGNRRDGYELARTIDQPHSGDGVIEDMTLVGNAMWILDRGRGGLWFVLQDTVYSFEYSHNSLDDIEMKWASPLENTTGITWGNDYDWNLRKFWLANERGEVRSMTQDGEISDTLILSWKDTWKLKSLDYSFDDPDDYNLYFTVYDTTVTISPNQLYKASPETGDTMFVASLDSIGPQLSGNLVEGYNYLHHAYLSLRDTVGGPLLHARHLRDYVSWMDVIPSEGTLESDSVQQIGVLLSSENKLFYQWYEGRLIFSHTTPTFTTVIPVIYSVWLDVKPDDISLPTDFGIISTYPNPFNASLKVEYNLRTAGNAALKLFTIDGRLAEEIELGYESSGVHTALLDAGGLPSGVYLLQLSSGLQSNVRKVVLLK